MNCTGTKAVIDSASRRNPISSEVKVHLSGCPDCRSYSDQTNALLSLLSAQPRVEAPADFNFQLRARIARAQAKPASPFGFLENIFGQTFSIRQAAASLAALAVMAAGTTLYFNQSSPQTSGSSMIASNLAPVIQPAAEMESPVSPRTVVPQTSAPIVRVVTKSQPRGLAMKPAALAQASNNEVFRVYNREKGHVSEISKSGYVIGAENSVSMARPVSFGSF